MEKWLVQIEFRYLDTSDEHYDNGYTHVSKTITLGIFDNFDDACNCGNAVLKNSFETRFKLNPNYNRKERFGKNNGAYGTKNTLISDLAYLTTPFTFFAKITRLDFGNIDNAISNAVDAENRYKEYKKALAFD